MKKLILLIQIFIFSISYSQEKLEGKFCKSINEFSSTCIEFRENSRFDFYTIGCLGIEAKGNGNYVEGNNKILLKFDFVKNKYKSRLLVKEIYTTDTDSIELNFKILDARDNSPLPATILLESKSFKYEDGLPANSFGETKILKKRNSKKEKYRISFIGFEVLELELSNSDSKTIKILLEQAGPKIISDKTFEYKFKKIEKNRIILEDETKFEKIES